MTRILELLTSVLIVAVLFVVVGVFLPSHRSLQHNIETSHPLRQVFDVLNSFKRFSDWNPLRQHDPQIKYTYSGAERGVGAQLNYSSKLKEVGEGSWHLTESAQDERIRYTVYNDSYGQNKNHLLELDQKGKLVNIDWSYSVDYGWSLPGRYAGLYVERTVGDDIKRSLDNLGNLIASLPNYDYRNLDVKVTTIAPTNILYVSTEADRNITAVENAMAVALKDIREAIKRNDLGEAGRPRLITTNYGSEKYQFDIAIPVARLADLEDEAEDEAADEADGADGEAADKADDKAKNEEIAAADDAEVHPAPEPLEDLNLPDNVHAGQSYGGKVVMVPYRGHPAQLPLVRDQLRSYAGAYGEVIHDRSFEEYLTEIEETAAADARFRVYWPIK